MTLYIAGPMTGYPEFNYPAFRQAERDLTAAGYDVLNPASIPWQASWDNYMRASIALLVQAHGVAVLDGWQMSAGATLEVHIAHALRVEVNTVPNWMATARL